MKLINLTTHDNEVKFINPHYVKTFKQTHQTLNDDWCIVIEMADNKVETILSKTEEESNNIMIKISEAMESIN